MLIEIYTDGAYSSSRNQGGWAFVVLKDGEMIHRGFDLIKNTTNNRMEISSVIEALKYIMTTDIEEFTLYSDSMYVIGTMTLNWKRKKNIDLWIIIDHLVNILSKRKINWMHVKGHSNNRWNGYCDMLAIHASQFKLDEKDNNGSNVTTTV
jgi:ribonuclease HI